MSKKIFITHTEDVSTKEAIQAVYIAIKDNIEVGEAVVLTNGIAVDYPGRTKNPSFYVWRREQ